MRLAMGLVIIGWSVVGCGGGGSGGGTSTPPSSPTGAAPTVVQMNTYHSTNADSEYNSTLQFKSLTTAGHTVWVAVTVPDYGGIHTISITDTQGNTYTQLDQQNDGLPGAQSVAHFYAAGIVGDTQVADTITVNWGYDNYKGILITELAGTTGAPLVGHASAIQDAVPAGTDNVASGPVTVASAKAPALLVAVSMNTSGGASDTGGSNFPGPAAGSGMTPVAVFWDWGQNLGTFVTATVTGAESITAVFNSPDTDSYVTVAAVFH